MVTARRCFRALFANSIEYDHYLQAAMDAVVHLCHDLDSVVLIISTSFKVFKCHVFEGSLICKVNFQLQHDHVWEENPSGIVHILNLIFELPFIGWVEFIEVGFTALCKMCANLGTIGQTIVASVWAGFDAEWIQDKVNWIQQVSNLLHYFCLFVFSSEIH